MSITPGGIVPTIVGVQSARFVTPKLFEALTGISTRAVEGKIARGVWAEGKHFRRRDGNVLLDLEEYTRWADKPSTSRPGKPPSG